MLGKCYWCLLSKFCYVVKIFWATLMQNTPQNSNIFRWISDPACHLSWKFLRRNRLSAQRSEMRFGNVYWFGMKSLVLDELGSFCEASNHAIRCFPNILEMKLPDPVSVIYISFNSMGFDLGVTKMLLVSFVQVLLCRKNILSDLDAKTILKTPIFSMNLRACVPSILENSYSETVSAHRDLRWDLVRSTDLEWNQSFLVSWGGSQRPQIMQFGVSQTLWKWNCQIQFPIFIRVFHSMIFTFHDQKFL